jgi:hypothetical protein
MVFGIPVDINTQVANCRTGIILLSYVAMFCKK